MKPNVFRVETEDGFVEFLPVKSRTVYGIEVTVRQADKVASAVVDCDDLMLFAGAWSGAVRDYNKKEAEE